MDEKVLENFKTVLTVAEIKHYFGCPGRPVDAKEMTEFWKSLTDSEKTFYKEGVGAILAS